MLIRGLAVTIILAFSLAFTGCTHYTLSEEQCKAGNWEQIGYQDGQTGYHHQRLSQHAEACNEYQLGVNKTRYLSGWNEGVKSYCTPQMGYREGINGEGYQNVCPTHLESAFLEQYHRGYSIYQIRSTYRSLNSQLEEINDDISELETKLVSVTETYDKKRTLDDLKRKRKERDRLSGKIRVYEMKHAQVLAE